MLHLLEKNKDTLRSDVVELLCESGNKVRLLSQCIQCGPFITHLLITQAYIKHCYVVAPQFFYCRILQRNDRKMTFDLHYAIVGLENHFLVFLRVAVLHRFYCTVLNG